MKNFWNKILTAISRKFAGIVAGRYDQLATFVGGQTISQMVATAQAKAKKMIENAETLRVEAGSIRSDADGKLQAAIQAARSQHETEMVIVNQKLATASNAVTEANQALDSADFLLGK